MCFDPKSTRVKINAMLDALDQCIAAAAEDSTEPSTMFAGAEMFETCMHEVLLAIDGIREFGPDLDYDAFIASFDDLYTDAPA